MTTNAPGEVTCPSCGRLTMVAPFCTHCGGVIPEGAARQRGLDRRELEERIRQRRGPESPFRRGSSEWDAAGSAARGGSAVFVPEPTDALARQDPDAADEAIGRVDYLHEQPPAPAPAPIPTVEASRAMPSAAPAGAAAAGAAAWPSHDLDEPEPATLRAPDRVASHAAADPHATPAPPSVAPVSPDPGPGAPYGALDGDGGEDGPPGRGYGDDGDDPDPPRGGGAVAVLGFLVLGIAALLGGAILFAVLNSSPGVAETSASPSASIAASTEASPTDTSGASPSGSTPAQPSGSAATSLQPDTFTASVQPCATSAMGFKGCTVDGSTLTGSKVWVWVGFKDGQASDLLGVTVVDHADGSAIGDGSLELSQLSGCDPGKTCTGYITMNFGSLTPGAYDITVTRNGSSVATASFTVTG